MHIRVRDTSFAAVSALVAADEPDIDLILLNISVLVSVEYVAPIGSAGTVACARACSSTIAA